MRVTGDAVLHRARKKADPVCATRSACFLNILEFMIEPRNTRKTRKGFQEIMYLRRNHAQRSTPPALPLPHQNGRALMLRCSCLY